MEISLTQRLVYFVDWQVNFARAAASLSKAQAKKVARFPRNPERHWGPKLRAGRQITIKHTSLLGADVVNELQKLKEGEDEAASKHKKTEEPTPNEVEDEPASKRKKTEESTPNL